jgi:hypothetical protein
MRRRVLYDEGSLGLSNGDIRSRKFYYTKASMCPTFFSRTCTLVE